MISYYRKLHRKKIRHNFLIEFPLFVILTPQRRGKNLARMRDPSPHTRRIPRFTRNDYKRANTFRPTPKNIGTKIQTPFKKETSQNGRLRQKRFGVAPNHQKENYKSLTVRQPYANISLIGLFYFV